MWTTFLISNLLSLTGLVVNSCKNTYSFLKRFQAKISRVFSSNVYVFFEDYSSPFHAGSVMMYSFYSAPVKYMYNADTYLFFSSNQKLNQTLSKRLPILSLEIIDVKSEALFDISSHIEKVRYVNVECPTICEIVMTWIIHTGVVFDRNKYRVRYIDESGNEQIVDIDSVDNLVDDKKVD